MILLPLMDFNNMPLQFVAVEKVFSTQSTRWFFSIMKLNVIRQFFFGISIEFFTKRTLQSSVVIMGGFNMFNKGREAFNSIMITVTTTKPLMFKPENCKQTTDKNVNTIALWAKNLVK